MKNYSVILTVLAVCLTLNVIGQHHGHHILPGNDSIPRTLGRDLDKGRFEFHARSFFMSTINKGELLDYSALATGAGIGYYSPKWKGFHFGFSGFFVFQLLENNIYESDPTTNNTNRYEILLFDMNDFSNRTDLDRLEELFLQYDHKKLSIKLGRQTFDSPLLNEQDNRMRENLYGGISAKYRWKGWKFIGAAFDHVTIRGTVDWYSIEESFGVYPFGRNPFGKASEYKGNIETLGIGVLGAKFKSERRDAQFWNYHIENVFNLSYGQVIENWKWKAYQLQAGLEGLYQSAVVNGGNSDPNKAFILPDESTFAIGGTLGVKKKANKFSLNYLHISDQGRFLFPREWGRERFFASLPRERFEGSGAVDALMLKYSYHQENSPWTMEFGVSSVNHARLDAYENNKYGIPSYFHFVGMVDYKFKGYLEGLDVKFLMAQKTAKNGQDIPDQFRINRVDLWNFNLIIDYRF